MHTLSASLCCACSVRGALRPASWLLLSLTAAFAVLMARYKSCDSRIVKDVLQGTATTEWLGPLESDKKAPAACLSDLA